MLPLVLAADDPFWSNESGHYYSLQSTAITNISHKCLLLYIYLENMSSGPCYFSEVNASK